MTRAVLPSQCGVTKYRKNRTSFNDKANHRYYPVDKVTTNLLQNWRKKEIYLLLHVYSLSVNNKSVFKTVKDTLLVPEARDRAGAASNKSVEELANKLRDKHGNDLQAHDMAWMMWANAIFTEDSCIRDTLIEQAPPTHLIKLFSAKEQPRIQSLKRSFAMAHSVNAGYHDEVIFIRKSFDELEEIFQIFQHKMNHLKRCIEALEKRDELGESFISAAEESVRVEESAFPESIASRVTEQDDIDHM